MAGIASNRQHRRVGVIDAERGAETVGVMAIGAVTTGNWVGGYCRRFGWCVNTIGFVVARFTGLYRCINYPMVEVASHIEAGDAMAYIAIDDSYGMTIGLTDRRNAVTGIAGNTRADDGRAGMVGKGTCEARNRVAGYAFDCGIRVWRRGRFTDGCVTVMTVRTTTGNTRMIKVAVGFQLEEAGSIVAAIAFAIRQ